MEPIRLFLIDQHEVVRTQLALRLDREPGYKVVGQSSYCEQALTDIRNTIPNVVIIDPVHRDGTCLEALRLIIEINPATVIVVLTAIPDTSLQLEMRRAGVQKILPKGIETERLLEELSRLVIFPLEDS